MEGATESEKNNLKENNETKKTKKLNSVHIEDLDGTGLTQPAGADPTLNPEKTKTVFMNLINVDEQAQVTLFLK